MTQRNYTMAQPEEPGGRFADFVVVWQTPDTFVLDFAAITAPGDTNAASGEENINAQVVSRVRIPPSQVFEIMKALEHQLSLYEKRHGRRAGQED